MSRYSLLMDEKPSDIDILKTKIPTRDSIGAIIQRLSPRDGDLYIVSLKDSDQLDVNAVREKFEILFHTMKVNCMAFVVNREMNISRVSIDGVESLWVQTPEKLTVEEITLLKDTVLRNMEINKEDLTKQKNKRPIIVH